MTAPRPLGYWLTTVDRLIDEQIADAVEAAGLTRPAWRVMSRLEHGSVRAEHAEDLLSPFVGGGAGSVTEVLDGLVAEGLAERQADDFRLTAAGHARVAALQEGPVEAVIERATDGLSPEACDALLTGLRHIARNLGWLDAS